VARGEYYRERGQELAAERDFISVVELQFIGTEEMFIARLQLGLLSIRRKQYDAARSHADEALTLKSLTRFKVGKLVLLRALAYRGLGKYDLASLNYKCVLSIPELDANLRKMAEQGERDCCRGANGEQMT
jgi:tetratricopeptide (TPR) repeat protein